MRDFDDCKRRLIDVWGSLQQSVIDDVIIASARLRLRGGVRVQEGIFDMVCYLYILEKR